MTYSFDLQEQLQNSSRLNEVMEMYEKIARATPREWRIGQTWVNFFSWHMKKYGNDSYYLTDNTLLKRYNEFMSEITIIPQGGR